MYKPILRRQNPAALQMRPTCTGYICTMGKCSLYLLYPTTLMLEDLILEYPEDPFWDGAVIGFLDLQHGLLFDPCWLLSPQRGQQDGGTGRVELKNCRRNLYLRDLLTGHDRQNFSGTERLFINLYMHIKYYQSNSMGLTCFIATYVYQIKNLRVYVCATLF